MIDPGIPRKTYGALQSSRLALTRAAKLARLVLFAAGLALFLDQVRPLVSDGQFTWGERRVMGAVALVWLGGFGAAGWAAGRILWAFADLLEILTDQADATRRTVQLLEAELAPQLRRAVLALEEPAGRRAVADPRAGGSVRKAISEGRWARAEEELRSFRRGQPGSPLGDELAVELGEARRAEAADLTGRLNAARAADDLDRVVTLRDALTQHLQGDTLDALDRRTARWAVDLVRRKVRSDEVTPELARAAERVTDSLADRPEVDELLAGLPDLRRRAGLCPRCARPIEPTERVCPNCRGRTGGANPGRPSTGNSSPERLT